MSEKKSKASKSKKNSTLKKDEAKKSRKDEESVESSEEEEETPEYEVEEVIEKKIKWGTIYYKVKWRGFSYDECTWEPEHNLGNCPLKIRAYENQLLEKSKEGGESSTKEKTSKAKNDKPASLSSPLEPESVTGKRARDKLDEDKEKEGDKENKNKTKKGRGKKKGSIDEDEDIEAGKVSTEDKPPGSTKKVENSASKAKQSEEKTLPSEEKSKVIEEEKIKEKTAMEEEKPAVAETVNKSISKDDQAKSNKNSVHEKKSTTKDEKATPVQKPTFFSLLQSDEKKDSGSQNIADTAQLNKLCQQVLTSNSTSDSATKNGLSHINQPVPLKAATNANQTNTPSKEAPKDTHQNSAVKETKTEVPKKDEGLSLSKIMQDEKLMELSENEDAGKNGAHQQNNKAKPTTPASNHAAEGHPSTKTKRKGKNESGSFEKGDTPVKVIGIRPVREVNDLEVMIAWKARDDGSKPYNSKVMRLELLRRGHWRPLLEFYESKMKLESAPSFDPTSLSKLNNN